jgi:hypothetical protein
MVGPKRLISLYISGPFTPNHGLESPYAWGMGWADTWERAEANALYYCQQNGGQSCQEWASYDSVPGGGTPDPAHETAGGEFRP